VLRYTHAGLRALAPDADMIVPIPLSRTRRFERGFNQAEIIARIVGKALCLPVDAYSLSRIKHTAMHRAGMDRKARERTVEKAFEVVRPKLVAGKRILLIDDVLTSGSTASSCAKILKAAGTRSVSLFTIARV
jgi:ComF family protein